MSQPHFEASVRMKLTLPKVRTWSPPRHLKTQSLIVGVKTPCIEVFFIPLENYWSVDVQNGLVWAFGHLQPMLWAKEGSRVKLPIWLPTTKSRESTRPGVCKWNATHRWKALKESYKFASDLILIEGLSKKLWMPKIPRIQNETVSGLHFGSPGKKCHSDASAVE
jgi:hypothetical protein